MVFSDSIHLKISSISFYTPILLPFFVCLFEIGSDTTFYFRFLFLLIEISFSFNR